MSIQINNFIWSAPHPMDINYLYQLDSEIYDTLFFDWVNKI